MKFKCSLTIHTLTCNDCPHRQEHEHRDQCDKVCSIFNGCCRPVIEKEEKMNKEKMSEVEIVEYLKKNSTMFSKMPEEVKLWCKNHIDSVFYYTSTGSSNVYTDDVFYYHLVYFLPAEFKLPEPPRYRQWTFLEIPIGKIIKHKTKDISGVIVGKKGDNYGKVKVIACNEEVDPKKLLEMYVLDDDGPCGVEI